MRSSECFSRYTSLQLNGCRDRRVLGLLMLDMHRLRLLRELSLRGTVQAVAAALGYSPSAVSQQLSKLQREVGAPLLERDGRRVRLTPQARILVDHTEAVLARLEQAEAEVAASTRQVAGRLHVATFQSVGLALIPAVLALLEVRHPGLQVEVSVQEPVQAIPGLLSRDFDVVFDEEYPGGPRPPDDRLERQLLLREKLLLVVPRSWGSPHDLDELMRRPWVTEPPGTAAHDWIMAYCWHLGFEPEVRFSFNDVPLRLRFVETSHAVAPLPDLAIGHLLPYAHVLALPGDPAREISTLVRASRVKHPAVMAFRDALSEVAASHGSAQGGTDDEQRARQTPT